MDCQTITIGDEILIGQITDTNSPWMAQQLNNIGIAVTKMISVMDTEKSIVAALDQAFNEVRLVIITGGLGPTNDDITKKTLTQYFGDELVLNNEVAAQLREFFSKLNFPFKESDLLQAFLPCKAHIFQNKVGTASGMWFEKDGKIAISLPGVPAEMKHLMIDGVLPKLQMTFELPFIVHKTIITYGLRESDMALRLVSFEKQLPQHIKFAYLPNYQKLRLRLTGKGINKILLEQEIDFQIQLLESYLTDLVIGYENYTLEEEIGKLLIQSGKTLSTAESFTGGTIAQNITSIAGASKYFVGSLVCYNEKIKIQELNVAPETIKKHSVVSAQVVAEMAKGIQEKFKTDFAIATTGNAGPTKEETEKKVGDIYIGIAYPGGIETFYYNFGQPREKVIKRGSSKALEHLYKIILKSL